MRALEQIGKHWLIGMTMAPEVGQNIAKLLTVLFEIKLNTLLPTK